MARVIVAANGSWNLANFRVGLIGRLLRAGHEVITLSPDSQGIRIDGAQLRHRVSRMDRSGTNPLRDITTFFEIFRILKQEKPDLFLGFTVKPNIYGCVACRMLGIPAFPNVSGLGTAFLGGSAFRRAILLLYCLAFARAKRVFFQNSDDMNLFLAERVVSLTQTRLIPGSGINLAEFTPSRLPHELNFLMIARLLGDKGVREYVEAARQLKCKYPAATFSLLGGLDDENRTAISQRELDGWIRDGGVTYLGSTSDVRPFIRGCSAVVLPSYREGLPRTLLEAAAMGRPLIGTDVPGCNQLIREGETGFLCQARNVNSLAEAMERFANASYEWRCEMAQNARRMAVEEFNEERVVDAYLSEIRKLSVQRHAA